MSKKKTGLCILFCFVVIFSLAQSPLIKQIDQLNTPDQSLAPLRFLASDELMGRATTRPEIHIAARYISEQFRTFGLRELSGTRDYLQPFEFTFITPGTSGYFTVGNLKFELGKDFLQARGTNIQSTAPVVFAGFGSPADLANLDVKGKIVVVNMGENESSPTRGPRRFRDVKQKLLQQKGAFALVERYWHSAAEWEGPREGFSHDRFPEAQDSMLPAFLVHDPGGVLQATVKSSATATLNVTGNRLVTVAAKNVMGWVEGTDPNLKKQFIILSAHYDHIGVAHKPSMEEGKLDSIYNGARDNAIGTTAVINAAKYFARHPPKRSIMFIAYTGEEMGLLGSRYFAAHPAIGLEKVVYNLNIDNASYNDTSRITVIGFGRTSADEDIKKACMAYGLTTMPDPVPEQNLFDRSDNVSLAEKGVPAPTFSLGIKAFDETITNRYHQLSDEVGNMDVNYALKYMRSFILAAKFIADNPAQPTWKTGDKYEAVWKAIYLKAH